MTKDPLEEFVISHKEQFNDLEPDPAVWDRIKADYNAGKTPRRFNTSLLLKAASLLLIFTTSLFIYFTIDMKKDAQSAGMSMEEILSDTPINELIEAEAYYTSIITQKQNEIISLASGNTDIREEIDVSMSELDSVYIELKRDLKDNADNEQVIAAMIQNYRLKLDILEEMQSQLKRINNTEKDEKDKSEQTNI